MKIKYCYSAIVLLLFSFYSTAQNTYNILDFGANEDSTVINTMAIQKAIDQCAARGGGRVVIPSGVFMSGTLYMKSNVELWLEPAAVLKGSPEFDDYENRAFIYAINQENISIAGRGKLNGNGTHEKFYSDDFYNGLKGRPLTVVLVNCQFVKLEDFTLVNAACWCIKLVECVNVSVKKINIISRAVANNDGLDIVDCHNVIVSDCYFDCGDDAICMKSSTEYGVKNLAITNCIIKSESNGIKFGTGSAGGFRNITISNCVIFDTRLSGIALEVVDGGIMDRVTICNITMHNVNGALFIKLGHRRGDKPGILQNVLINNVIADGIGLWKPETQNKYYKPAKDPRIGISIAGQPGFFVENVTLSNIRLQFAGGGTPEHAKGIMEDTPEVYPEYSNFGITPAYGINCRHVKNIVFENVQLEWIKYDARPALFFENVKDVSISRLQAKVSVDARSFIRLKDVDNVFIHSCKPDAVKIPFLSLEGNANNVSVVNNDLRQVKKVYTAEASVKKDEVFVK